MYDNNDCAVLIRELSDTQLSGDKALVEVLEGVHEGEIVPIDTYELSPIPLTPEILEKNGFGTRISYIKDKWNNEYTLIEDDNKVIYWEKGNVYMERERADSYLFACNYVHELQHALRLCGVEKKIVL